VLRGILYLLHAISETRPTARLVISGRLALSSAVISTALAPLANGVYDNSNMKACFAPQSEADAWYPPQWEPTVLQPDSGYNSKACS
jgi:hypothetical protein